MPGALAAAVFLTVPAASQRVELAEGSAVLPRGTIRVTLGGTHATQRDRYRDGTKEPLGAPLAAPALGPTQLPLLGSIEQEVRGLGLPTFGASLGTSRLDARQRIFATPLGIEVGVTRWLTLGAEATLVRTKAEALLRLRGDSGRATLGANPVFLGLSVAASNLATIGTYSTASQNLQSRRDDCGINPLAYPECPTILAESGDVNTLITGTSAFATGLATLYGTGVVPGSPYVPLEGSPAEVALLARVDSIRQALERYGVTDVTASTGLPLGAQAPLGSVDLAQMILDPARGFGAKALNDAGLTAIGDVRFSAALRLVDGLRCRAPGDCVTPRRAVRQTAIVEFQLGTGARPRSDRLLDQGTGSGFNSLSVRSLTELVLGRRFTGALHLAATAFARDEARLRVPSTAFPGYLEAWRDTVVPMTPGPRLEVGLVPRLRLGESFSLGLDWLLVWQGEGRHDLTATVLDVRGASVTLSGAALDSLSGSTEQIAGLSASYSMIPALTRGLRRPPLAIDFRHRQTLFGHAGIVVKRWEDRITFRYYARFRDR